MRKLNSDLAYLFISKVSVENGIVLPFIYVGKGKITNPQQVKFDIKQNRNVVIIFITL